MPHSAVKILDGQFTVQYIKWSNVFRVRREQETLADSLIIYILYVTDI
jgi:hypothetical protein